MKIRFHIMKMACSFEIAGEVNPKNTGSLEQFKRQALIEFWQRYSGGKGAHGSPEYVRLYRESGSGIFQEGEEIISDEMLAKALQTDQYFHARFLTQSHVGES